MRQHLLNEASHVINPVMDAAKLRQISSGFKRHSIRRLIRPLDMDPAVFKKGLLIGGGMRKSVSDYFFIYTRQVLPKIEDKIELQLLERFKSRIGNEMERKEVTQAYLNRKDNLAKMEDNVDMSPPEKPQQLLKVDENNFRSLYISIDGSGMSHHTYADIGRYTVFQQAHTNRMFPGQYFGNYMNDEFKRNGRFGIMTREEGLRLTNDFSRLTLPHERQVNYEQILRSETSEINEDVIKDDQKFVAIQQDFSLDLIDYINSKTGDDKVTYQRLFQSAAVFDSFISILIKQLKKKPIRYHLCIKEARQNIIDQLAQALHKIMMTKQMNPQNMSEIIDNVKLVNLELHKKNLGPHHELQAHEVHRYKLYLSGYHKICYQQWRPEEMRRISLDQYKGNNTGVLLWGPRGTGKSQILTYATAWAHENRWMVITVPRCEMFTDGTEEIFRHENGFYLQKDLAKNYLYNFRKSNELLLRNTDVDMQHYGKFDMTGHKDGDPDAFERYWDVERQCWSDSWKEFLFDAEIKTLTQEYEEMRYRCADKLPDPKKLIDIADLGIQHPELATNCFREILEQIYHTDKFHTLIALDGYNDWFKPSEYVSFRYDNSPYLRGRIPPQDFAMVRMLMKFDGHMLRNGVKIATTTHYRQFRHLCTPEMINMPPGYSAKVENLALNDFRNMLNYYHHTRWMNDYYQEHDVESLYMETQGNWTAFHETYNRYQRLHY